MTQTLPQTKTVDVVDDFHGTPVPDPYRWLEDIESRDVVAWVEAQNELAHASLEQLPRREALAKRLLELFARPRRGAPWRRGSSWFQLRNDGTQELDVLYVMTSPDDDGRVLLDPNQLSTDASLSVQGTEVSWDGRLLAWQAVESGSSWGTIRFRDVASGEDLDDRIEWAKFLGAWAPDGKSFYYATFPPPAEGERFQASSVNQRLYRHVLGQPQSEDAVIFERPDKPTWLFMGPRVTDDRRYMVVECAEGTDTRIWLQVLDFARPESGFAELTHGDAFYAFAASDEGTLYVRTDQGAARGRLIAIDLDDPAPEHWREVVPEGEGSLTGRMQAAARAGRTLIVTDVFHSAERLRRVDLDSGAIADVDLPVTGAISLAAHLAEDEDVHLAVYGFATPPQVLRLDAPSGAVTIVGGGGDDLDEIVVEQTFAPTTGGARIPMVLMHAPGTKRSGDVPVFMNGYGGFGLSWLPGPFRPWQVARAWVELGGLAVSTNLRGGAEYGAEWHAAGKRETKQNVFDDFAACARHLIETGWTAKGGIAINGASNGGLLVAATEVQFPDLFGACIPEVGVLDMLRYHRWTSGIFWVGDYGNADVAEDFAFLAAYSPVHNVKAGTAYPATLVMASYNDDHVVPGHSFKFTAALQAAQSGDAPVLMRTEMKIGHGGGKPVSMQVADRADVLAFALDGVRAALDAS
jgi:prolyl oligopeptidase